MKKTAFVTLAAFILMLTPALEASFSISFNLFDTMAFCARPPAPPLPPPPLPAYVIHRNMYYCCPAYCPPPCSERRIVRDCYTGPYGYSSHTHEEIVHHDAPYCPQCGR